MQTFSKLLFVFAVAALSGCGGAGVASTPSESSVVAPNASDDTMDGAASLTASSGSPLRAELLNVSYDPTRELWKDLNAAFIAQVQIEGGEVTIKQSHGASGSQARAVIDGLEADVVSLALWPDTDQLRKKELIQSGWEDKFPNRSLPYTSSIVFVVRKGNPKGIKDWADLVKPGIEIITPSPKTSGNGKLAFLAAWGSVTLNGGDEEKARAFVTQLYKQVPVLDTGARGATTTFAQKGIGDVHLTWESEAHLEIEESKGELELIYPSQSFLAEPYIALVDANVDRKGTRKAAEAYLNFAYTPEGQEIIAKHYYRPTNAEVLARNRSKFPDLKLFKITDVAAGWDEAQAKFFAEGALFDSIYQAK
jgi:sulfate transport system substrate-binding protein